MADTFWVEVVAADRRVWEGEASQVIATTTEGAIGILAHHIPLIAALAPGTAEVTAANGMRHIVAVDGGFISVTSERTSVIAPYAQMAGEIDVTEARQALLAARQKRDNGDNSIETMQAYRRAVAQVKAAEHYVPDQA